MGCASCKMTDMPCVTPFTTSLYPDKVFCSATCVLQKWESEHRQQYNVKVSEIVTLSKETKYSLFGRSWKQNAPGKGNPRELIKRIKRLDQRIGERFLERTLLIENTVVRMAYLTNFCERSTPDATRPHLANGDRDQERSPAHTQKRIRQLMEQLRGGQSARVHPAKADCPQVSSQHSRFDSFIAVSYCWHAHDWELTASIRDYSTGTQKFRSPISQKMLTALNLLRKDDLEGVWIDQLCINQAETLEKRNAIASMDIIYNRARFVAIILEDIQLSCDELRIWKKIRKERMRPNPDTLAAIIKVFTKITSSRWSTRAWCYQEYLFSQKYVFLIPCEGNIVLISQTVFQDALNYRTAVPGNLKIPAYVTILHVIQSYLYKSFTVGGYRSVADLLAYLTQRQSRFLADKLSIMLNIYGADLVYYGTPVSSEEFCYICIIIALAEGNITVLCHSGDQLRLEPSRAMK
jgi:hypothetical protein